MTLGREIPVTRRRRQVLTGSVVGVLAVAVGAVTLSLSGTAAPVANTGDGDLPSLVSRHLEALPESGGLEGPGGAANQAYLARAYPAGI